MKQSHQLEQHTKRAAYQAGCIWSQSTVHKPETQDPAEWSCRKKDGLWHVFLTDLPPIAESCQQLTKCGCRQSAVKGASATALDLPALQCVAVNVTFKHVISLHWFAMHNREAETDQ